MLQKSEGKLRTYALLKRCFCREPYCTVLKDKYVKNCFTKIETGRYKYIQSDKRLCEKQFWLS